MTNGFVPFAAHIDIDRTVLTFVTLLFNLLCRYDELVAQGIDLEQETTEDSAGKEDTAEAAAVEVETKEDGVERAESARLRSSSTASNGRQLSTASATAGGLVEEEERSTGDVDSKAYWHYLYSMGWG